MKYIDVEEFKGLLERDSVCLTEDLYVRSKELFSDIFIIKQLRHLFTDDSNSIIKQTFSGSLDGNGHTVNLPHPLFFKIDSDSSLENIHFEFRSTVSENFIATNNYGSLRNVSVSGKLASSEAVHKIFGGLVGTNHNVIRDCSFSGKIKTFQNSEGSNLYRDTGGIAGHNKGIVDSCSVSGSIIGPIHVGGIAGYNNGTVKKCDCSDLTVKGLDIIGGIVGKNNKKILNCIMKQSKVRGDFYEGQNMRNSIIGGIVGFNSVDTSVSNCALYDCTIEGEWKVGGVGGINRGSVEQCEVDPECTVSGTDIIGGCVGSSEYDSIVQRCLIEAECTGLKNIGGVAGKVEEKGTCKNMVFTGDCSIESIQAGYLFGNISTTKKVMDCYYNGSDTNARLVGETVQDTEGLYNLHSKDFQDVICLAGL